MALHVHQSTIFQCLSHFDLEEEPHKQHAAVEDADLPGICSRGQFFWTYIPYGGIVVEASTSEVDYISGKAGYFSDAQKVVDNVISHLESWAALERATL